MALPSAEHRKRKSARRPTVLVPLPAWQVVIRDPFPNTTSEGGRDWI